MRFYMPSSITPPPPTGGYLQEVKYTEEFQSGEGVTVYGVALELSSWKRTSMRRATENKAAEVCIGISSSSLSVAASLRGRAALANARASIKRLL